MINNAPTYPFKTGFLNNLSFYQSELPFSNSEIIAFDKKLFEYEQRFINLDLEKHLIAKNQFLASYAISKAENSSLTVQEAQNLFTIALDGKDLKTTKNPTQKDYDKKEFLNIARTFRLLSQNPALIKNLSVENICKIHALLCANLDNFEKAIPNFTQYVPGKLRKNDNIRVGNYIPAPYQIIGDGILELTKYLRSNPTPIGIAVFHTALYALHPFNNGNKRVCRILEHFLLRDIGLNAKNLYGTSYYYHSEKPRYYKFLLHSLERKNLNYFTGFILEALFYSIATVVKAGLIARKQEWLKSQDLSKIEVAVLLPLTKRKETQFKWLYNKAKTKVSKQTFVNYLKKATDLAVVQKKEVGKLTFYKLNFDFKEQNLLDEWEQLSKKRLSYTPNTS
ncbi:Fic family protein [Candidatus Parcubacteria bacterium]|nr:Fic family protein [Patescibacteria group bacterium]MBU4380946.1 Fic family protein [Patescibacteria group bacterium]MCG2689464.1 Fic family protein [Candidatus Parcubacteria bacterium]